MIRMPCLKIELTILSPMMKRRVTILDPKAIRSAHSLQDILADAEDI